MLNMVSAALQKNISACRFKIASKMTTIDDFLSFETSFFFKVFIFKLKKEFSMAKCFFRTSARQVSTSSIERVLRQIVAAIGKSRVKLNSQKFVRKIWKLLLPDYSFV